MHLLSFLPFLPVCTYNDSLPLLHTSHRIITAVGADIDALGFLFLRNVTSSVLTNVQYEGVSQQLAVSEIPDETLGSTRGANN